MVFHWEEKHRLPKKTQTGLSQNSYCTVYVLQVRRLSAEKNKYAPSQIITMDETPIWSDMVSATIRLIRQARKQSRWRQLAKKICRKLREPMVVFKNAKCETSAVKKEFRRHIVVASSKNAFTRHLLAWDSFECHIERSVACSLKSNRINVVLVPGGCIPSTLRHLTRAGTSHLEPQHAPRSTTNGSLRLESTSKSKAEIWKPHLGELFCNGSLVRGLIYQPIW